MATSTGINRNTGQVLEDWDHTNQSILDIFTTPKRSRVMRRGYGSEAPDLIDEPMVQPTLADFAYALGDGLDNTDGMGEPRFSLERMWVNKATEQGYLEPAVDGTHYPLGHLGDFSVKHTVRGVRNSDEG